MHRSGLIFLLLLLCYTHANARHRHEKKQFKPANQAFMVGLGLGKVGGFPAIVAGVEYEHAVLRKGRLSLILPVTFYNGGTFTLGAFGYGDIRSKIMGFYAAPGVRYHPIGNEHRVDPGIGAAVALGRAYRRDRKIDNYGQEVSLTNTAFFNAILFQATVNVHVKRDAMIGLFLNYGYIFSNTSATALYYNPVDDPAYFVLGFRIGGDMH